MEVMMMMMQVAWVDVMMKAVMMKAGGDKVVGGWLIFCMSTGNANV
jgi:hypothetical protein